MHLTVGLQALLRTLLLYPVPKVSVVELGSELVCFALQGCFVQFLVDYLLAVGKRPNYLIISHDLHPSRIFDGIWIFLAFVLHDCAQLLSKLDKSLFDIL